jgi:hypothetical protein
MAMEQLHSKPTLFAADELIILSEHEGSWYGMVW